MKKLHNIEICYLGSFLLVFAIPTVAEIVNLSFCFIFWDFSNVLIIPLTIMRALIILSIALGTILAISFRKEL